jgi:hypothetical protein
MGYNQRKHIMSKEAKLAMSKWANKPREESDQITKKRRDTWDNLNRFLIENGASITSVQYASPIRIEVEVNSTIPQQLRDLGFDPIYLSEETRIGAPVSTRQGWRHNGNTAYSFRRTCLYELQLPK